MTLFSENSNHDPVERKQISSRRFGQSPNSQAQFNSDSSASDSITVDYVLRRNVNRYLLQSDKGLKGIVQEFIDPKDNFNSMFGFKLEG